MVTVVSIRPKTSPCGPDTMPFALEPGAVAVGAVLLIVMGMLGAALTTLRVTRVDPLEALGAQR
ncbi:hypothetical protein ACFWWS_38560 [Streptomyces sp. NPDC059083]|uniref:hypothetical protein n=1 Tax=Streptomyces sp. NPDC059083 TaxID=3346721 RepID=UPI003676BA81